MLNAKQAQAGTEKAIENRNNNNLRDIEQYCETVIMKYITQAIKECKYCTTIETVPEDKFSNIKRYLETLGYDTFVYYDSRKRILRISWDNLLAC